MTNLASTPFDRQAHEAYPWADSRAAPRFMTTRTAESQAAFLLPHLRSGMDLLDCGCGPGSITVGLAHRVAPGRAVGIDINPNQIELAQTSAVAPNVLNLHFETANIYRLPFPDDSFDAVFTTSVLMYLSDPVAALREMHRVLKPGSVAGIRNPDHEAQLCAPPDPLLKRFWQLVDALIRHKGGNPNFGKHQHALLRQAGFTNIQANANCECRNTTETTRQWAEVLAGMLRETTFMQQVGDIGLAEPAELVQISQAWQEWGEHPDAFFVSVFAETLGWKA